MEGERFFFFNDTATTEIYTLSLHDALPIYDTGHAGAPSGKSSGADLTPPGKTAMDALSEEETSVKRALRSEEHTSELQSRQYLVCRLLLEKKNTHAPTPITDLENRLTPGSS